MAWFECTGGSGGGGQSVTWTRTQLYTGGTSSSTTITLSVDYHNYDIIEFTCQNADTGRVTSLVTTPEILDSMFQYSTYVCFNECSNNQYCCFSKTTNTSWEKKTASRYLYVSDVYGLKCDGTVTKTTLYERQGYNRSAAVITGSGFLDYDYIFFSTCNNSNDETIICIFPFQCGNNAFSTEYNTFVTNYYNSWFQFNISDTSIATDNHWFMVQGIKIT